MQNVKILLDKPYARHGEEPSTATKVDLSAEFNTQEDALKFHSALIELLCKFAGYKP